LPHTTSTDAAAPQAAEPTVTWYRRPAVWTWIGIGLAVLVFAVLAWNRRWMSDDGLIALRTVRQILEGNGPVFNVGERVEVNTTTLWTYILVVLGLIPGISLEWAAVVTGLVFAVAGVFLGLDAARRLLRPVAPATLLLPAGVLVVCALPPFLDFATSGLETGLATLWLAGTWWLLVRRGLDREDGRVWPIALVIGLGPLVRPDLALFSLVAGVALLVLLRPGWRRALAWIGVAAALPLAYQIFRMGYYGLLVPNTALAKEASRARWDRGLNYLADLITPYLLWLPLVLLAAAAVFVLRRHMTRPVTVLIAVPLLAGLLLALYVVRVGGDFMHGRMLLPALFCVLLPVFVLPATRWTVVPIVGVAVWAVVAGGWLRVSYEDEEVRFVGGTTLIVDERGFWAAATGHSHPIEAEDFLGMPVVDETMRALNESPHPSVFVSTVNGEAAWRTYPTFREHSTIATLSIGGVGMLAPLDMWVHDTIGLAYPLASHTTVMPNGRTGHEKRVGPAWEIADSARGVVDRQGTTQAADPARVEAVRDLLACPKVEEMMASVRAPLTFERFWDNLTGAFSRNGLRYDRDPLVSRTCT
jgi:arabinofuranosyltransferase